VEQLSVLSVAVEKLAKFLRRLLFDNAVDACIAISGIFLSTAAANLKSETCPKW